MAAGFKVASAYISVETEDDTDRGQRAIEEKGNRWAGKFGDGMGKGVAKAFGHAFTSALSGIFSGLIKPLLVLGAIQLASGLVSALAPATNALLLLPAALIAAATAVATLKIAFNGLGEALSAGWSGDIEAMAEAFKKLTPAAKETVLALIGLKPLVDSLKKSVQSATLEGLGSQIAKLGKTYLPMLQMSLTQVGRSFNRMFKDIAKVAGTQQFKMTFLTTMGSTAETLKNITSAVAPLLSGLNAIGAAGARVFAKLTSNIGEASATWAEKMNTMFQSGELESMIFQAMSVIGDLFKIFADLAGVLGTVMKVASTAGGDMLGMLVDGADALNKWVKSAEGMQFLTTVFKSVHDTFAALKPLVMPVLAALRDAIMVIAPVLPVMAAALAPLGPALAAAIGPIAEMFKILGPALAHALAALAPLLPVIGMLVGLVGGVFAQALQVLTPLLSELATLLADLIKPLVPLIDMFMAQLMPVLAEIGRVLIDSLAIVLPVLVDLFKELAPPILEVIDALADALLPVLPVLAKLFADIVKAVLPLAVILIRALVPVINALAPLFVKVATVLGELLLQALEELLPVFEWLVPIIAQLAVDLVPVLIPLIESLAGVFLMLLPILQPLAEVILVQLVRIVQALLPFIEFAAKVFTVLALVLTPIIALFAELIGWILGLLQKMGDLRVIGQMLADFFGAIGRGAWAAITTVLGWFGSLGAWILAKFVAVGTWLFDTGRRLIRGLIDGISNMMLSIWAWIIGLPGWLWQQFKNAVSWLYDVGRNIIRGIINGIKSMIFDAVGAILDVSDEMRAAMEGSWGIGSPSKVMATYGRQLLAGLRNGMRAGVPGLVDQVNGIAGLITNGNLQAQISGRPGSLAVQIPGGAPAPPPVYVVADFGNGVRQVIATERASNPAEYAAAVDEGRRRRSFVHTPRART